MQTSAYLDEVTVKTLLEQLPGEVVLRKACPVQGSAADVPPGLTTDLVRARIEESRDCSELAWWLDQLGRLLAFRYRDVLEALQGDTGEE